MTEYFKGIVMPKSDTCDHLMDEEIIIEFHALNPYCLMRITACLVVALCAFCCRSWGQIDTSLNKAAQFPNKLFAKLTSKTASLDDALTKQTQKYLARMAKKERKLQEKIYKLDSNAAKNLFNGTQEKYASLAANMGSTTSTNGAPLTGEYLPYVDSMKSSLAFAQQNPAILNASPKIQAEISASLAQFNQLQNHFSNADQVKQYIQQRKQAMKDQLLQYEQNSIVKKYLDQYNAQVYYYSEQVKEYKEALNDPDKMMEKALVILNKIPAFTRFIQQNGQLAGLFGISSNYGTAEGVVGLQTRDEVQQLLQNTVSSGGAGGMAALQSSLQSAHEQLDQFKDKLSSLGGGSGDIDMPNFKPNDQKTKTFLKRLEVGANPRRQDQTVIFQRQPISGCRSAIRFPKKVQSVLDFLTISVGEQISSMCILRARG
jgi:hypothetical protein